MDSESKNPSIKNENERITLQVGERRFTTLRDTLVGESEYFAVRLSGSWNDAEEDGSYFVDSDPTLFEHVLGFLRSGNYPVFFDSASQTFDCAKYISLLGEARYFGIRKLEDWIHKEKYLDVVHLQKSVRIVDRTETDTLQSCFSVNANTKTEVSVSWHMKKVYICPRGIYVHRGDRSRCGRACENARGLDGGSEEFEEELLPHAVVTTTKVVLNLADCAGR
ncbi:hypothetical protein F5Y13DRAFT_176083 [Hypoxylon sp. FL1857]|nr:hypothetical protein F5Y13DRAFT_176083 [Hypoxylon sp. FL1857]